MQRQNDERAVKLVFVGEYGAKFLCLVSDPRAFYVLDDSSKMFAKELDQKFSFVVEFSVDKFLFVPERPTEE